MANIAKLMGVDVGGSCNGFESKVSVYLGSDQTGVADSTWTKIEVDTEEFDGLGEFDNTTNYRFTAQNSGYYLVIGSLKWESIGGGDVIQVAIQKNGAAISAYTITLNTSVEPVISTSKIVYLDGVNDYIELWGRHTHGINRSAKSGAAVTFLTIHRLS